MTPLEKAVKAVVDTYPELGPHTSPGGGRHHGSPCSTVFFDDTGSRESLIDACHSSVQLSYTKYNNLVTSLPNSTPIDLAYYQMLLDIPFKNFTNHFSIEKTEDGHYYALVRDIPKIPPQVLYNFVIATRTPVEWSFYWFEKWSKLCKAGVNPMLAFILSTNKLSGTKGNDPLVWTFKDRSGSDWHFWFDKNVDWSNLLTASVTLHTYGCTPCNTIWGSNNYEWFTSQKGLTVQQISDKFGCAVIPNPEFPEYEGKTFPYNDTY